MNPRFPVANARQVIAALRRAGFRVDRISGSHHMMVYITAPKRAVTVPFHGARNIKPGTLHSIIRQSGLTVDVFRKLL